MWGAVKPGTVIADSFTVLRWRDDEVPPHLAPFVTAGSHLDLDARFENSSFLIHYELRPGAPPLDQWPFILPLGLAEAAVTREWTPARVPQLSRGLELQARQLPGGTRVALVEVMARLKRGMVVAIVTWQGFPLLNRFFVGVKPGMTERAEALLLAGLTLAGESSRPT